MDKPKWPPGYEFYPHEHEPSAVSPARQEAGDESLADVLKDLRDDLETALERVMCVQEHRGFVPRRVPPSVPGGYVSADALPGARQGEWTGVLPSGGGHPEREAPRELAQRWRVESWQQDDRMASDILLLCALELEAVLSGDSGGPRKGAELDLNRLADAFISAAVPIGGEAFDFSNNDSALLVGIVAVLNAATLRASPSESLALRCDRAARTLREAGEGFGPDQTAKAKLWEELASEVRKEAGTGGPGHPEDFCERCGRPNVTWFAPSDLWNRAVPEGGILCPVCFVQAAERVGIEPTAWCVAPEKMTP